MKYFSVVVDWQSVRGTWRTSRARVEALDEIHACEIVLDKVKKHKLYLKFVSVSILKEI